MFTQILLGAILKENKPPKEYCLHSLSSGFPTSPTFSACLHLHLIYTRMFTHDHITVRP